MKMKFPTAENFKERVVPGDAISPEVVKHFLQGTGKADGVIFLCGRKNVFGMTEEPSLELEAMRYIRGHSKEWQALNGRRRGRCRPDFFQIMQTARNAAVGAQIFKMSNETVQKIDATFFMCSTKAWTVRSMLCSLNT